ncbi:amidohydrolase family protein [Alicyclobacillus macrosporangiidus]|uniref:amidohydrolase family protein n=1 Tax=Alicyclobacillus macrosporangiidus TaxID=392015 RepID=UPI00054D5DB9|nr:amidohydrolase family protein [Alicyclobacillus macrosporangiidus]
MNIDLHSHIIPSNVVHEIRNRGHVFGAELQIRNGQEWVVHKQGYQYPLHPHFYDHDAKVESMNNMDVDFTVMSPAPPLFMYWIEPEVAAKMARMVNQGASEFVQAHKKRFRALATVPMQDPKKAVEELEYASHLPGLCGVEIGTTIEGTSLDDPRYDSFFSACQALNWPIFLHPYYVGDKQGMSSYYWTNLIGNPLDTTMAAAALIFGGVLDRYPNLRVLLAHGGGYLPYQIGRLNHGYKVRSESRTCRHKPMAYLQRFYYDTITFDPKALSFLLDMVGSANVVLGTDYPFDMGEDNPVGMLRSATEDEQTVHQVTCENALNFLGLSLE